MASSGANVLVGHPRSVRTRVAFDQAPVHLAQPSCLAGPASEYLRRTSLSRFLKVLLVAATGTTGDTRRRASSGRSRSCESKCDRIATSVGKALTRLPPVITSSRSGTALSGGNSSRQAIVSRMPAAGDRYESTRAVDSNSKEGRGDDTNPFSNSISVVPWA